MAYQSLQDGELRLARAMAFAAWEVMQHAGRDAPSEDFDCLLESCAIVLSDNPVTAPGDSADLQP